MGNTRKSLNQRGTFKLQFYHINLRKSRPPSRFTGLSEFIMALELNMRVKHEFLSAETLSKEQIWSINQAVQASPPLPPVVNILPRLNNYRKSILRLEFSIDIKTHPHHRIGFTSTYDPRVALLSFHLLQFLVTLVQSLISLTRPQLVIPLCCVASCNTHFLFRAHQIAAWQRTIDNPKGYYHEHQFRNQ